MGRCVGPPADRDQPNRSHVHAEAAPGRRHERDLYRHRNEAETAGRQSSAEKDLDPNAAATPTRSPAHVRSGAHEQRAFRPHAGGASGPPLLEIAEAAEALFDLALFFLGEGADRLPRQRPAPIRVRLEPDGLEDLVRGIGAEILGPPPASMPGPAMTSMPSGR